MSNFDKLRKRAEENLEIDIPLESLSSEEIKELIYELQVHQIELELQNEELRQTQQKLSQVRDRYINLYDFAPVGYLTLSVQGLIQEANLTLATMLGVERTQLMGRLFNQFVVSEDRDIFFLYYRRLLKSHISQTCEVKLQRKDGVQFYVQLDSTPATDQQDVKQIRIAISNITKRKQAEEALRESEARYRTIVEDQLDLICRFRPDGTLTFVNQAYSTYFGQRIKDLMDSDIFDSVFASDRSEVEAYLSAFSPSQPVSIYEHRVVNHQGEIRWLHRIDRAFFDGHGTLVEFQSAARDITERKQMEAELRLHQDHLNDLVEERTEQLSYINEQLRQEISERKQVEKALQESEAMYRAVVENYPDTLVMFDHDLRYFLVGGKGLGKVGLSADKMVGKTLRQIYPLQTFEQAEEIYQDALAGRGHINEKQFKDRYYIIHTVPIKDETGNIVAGMQLSQDITDLKQAEKAHQKSETFFQAVWETAGDAMVLTDFEGKVLQANPTYYQLFQGLADQIVGQKFSMVFPEEERETFEKGYQKIFEGEEEPSMFAKEIVLRDSSRRFVEAKATFLTDEQNQHPVMLTIIRDVTERNRLEEQLRQSQKMEAVGQLAGGVAHHFNNMLTAIIGYVELVLLELPPDQSVVKDLQRVQETVERAATLTQQLLIFTRKQVVNPKVVNLNDLLLEMYSIMKQLISETIELKIDLAPDLGQVRMDASQFEQLLVNLVVNASDAMSQTGGQLTLETMNIELPPLGKSSFYSEIIPGHYVLFRVTDTGVGITDEIKSYIFEPFFTTKEVGQGTGLGLSTCFGIVKQYNGYITVDSEPGNGTTFNIYFPRLTEKVDISPKDAPTSLPTGMETVLLVEDDASVRELASRVLERQGYHVLVAENGEKALHLVEEQPDERIHLLLTDIIMPRLGGDVLADRLKRKYIDLKVLFVSGYADEVNRLKNLESLKAAFLSKPFTPTTLAKKVRTVLDHSKE